MMRNKLKDAEYTVTHIKSIALYLQHHFEAGYEVKEQTTYLLLSQIPYSTLIYYHIYIYIYIYIYIHTGGGGNIVITLKKETKLLSHRRRRPYCHHTGGKDHIVITKEEVGRLY
jgi:hypothetical protein